MTDHAHKPGVVIVGAGQAGAEMATALRQQGYADDITLVGEEAYLPYRRPPLSKAFLAGEATLESLYLKPAEVYARHGINYKLGVRVENIGTSSHALKLSDGSELPYQHLVLATGGQPRLLPVPGADNANVHYLRTVEDVKRLRSHMIPDAHLVLIGGGYVGLETAAVAVKLGLRVTVVETMDRVLARVAAPELSKFYEKVHRQKGVEIICNAAVTSLKSSEGATQVQLADDRVLSADLVIAGIGLVPETKLAEAAGIAVEPAGILVDATCRTSVPDIYAIGDCTFHENDFYGRHMRLESVPHATEQARTLASILCGKPARYSAVPWFWSDQYDLKLQMVGLSKDYDEFVVRGEVESSSFIAFYLQEGVVICAEAVNRPQDFMAAKRLVANRITATPQQLKNEGFSLKSLLQKVAEH